MWKISQIICLGILVGMSVVDIRFRKVPALILRIGCAGAVIYQCIYREQDIFLLLGGALIGTLFVFISRVTEEQFGYGDSWAIFILGIYLGIWGVLTVLAGAFMLLIPAGLICFIVGKMKKNFSVPFYPFLTCGYLIALAAGMI